MSDKQLNIPNLVSGLANNPILNTPYVNPSINHSVNPSINHSVNPSINPTVNSYVNQVGAVTPSTVDVFNILGHDLPKKYVYAVGLIVVLVVGYFLWNWYNKKNNGVEDESDSEDDSEISYFGPDEQPPPLYTQPPKQPPPQTDYNQPLSDNNFDNKLNNVNNEV